MDQDCSKDPPPVEPDDSFLAELVADAISEDPHHSVWSDERFLTWLANRSGERPSPDESLAGQRLIIRAFCRKFGIRLVDAPPAVLPVRSEPGTDRLAPMIELSELPSLSTATVSQGAVIPAGCEQFNCVASRVVHIIECFAPFIHVGDTMLIALSPPMHSPAAIVCAVDDRVVVSNDIRSNGFIGVLIALWSERVR